MDSESARCVAMMAIKPQFAFRLLTGEKQVEFRRRAAANSLTHIVVYATQPVAAVVGVLEIADLARDTPRSLWRRFAEVGGIRRADFFDYFSGSRTGVAYLVREAWSCSEALELGKSGLPKVPPQAYQYLSFKTIKKLEASRAKHDTLEGTSDYESWLTRHCTRRATPGRLRRPSVARG
jgi:predicted transcriptional regulator